MTYRQTTTLLVVMSICVILAGICFLLSRQISWNQTEKTGTSSVVPVPKVSETPLLKEIEVTPRLEKKLKNFGQCGKEEKNDIILSYSPDLLNALLDGVQESHCDAPKPGYPNYVFILKDPSLVRLAEMTPDYKYIFYVKVETSESSSTYYLYKTDIQKKETVLLETYILQNDWPLQKDFYEPYLLPFSLKDGKYIVYNWFVQDPKGDPDVTKFLKGKVVDAESNSILFTFPCGVVNHEFPPDISAQGNKILFGCEKGELYFSNFTRVKKLEIPSKPENTSSDYTYYRFKDAQTIEVGYGADPLFFPVPNL